MSMLQAPDRIGQSVLSQGHGSVPKLLSNEETEPRSSKPGSKRYSDKVRGISQTVAYKGLLLKTQHPQI